MSKDAPASTIEHFAQLCALLDDGFAGRIEILAAAELDEAAWYQLRAAWLPLLAAGDALDLAQRFARAYGHARRHPGYLALPEAAPTPRNAVPGDLEAHDTDASSPPTMEEADRTHATAFPLAGPATPFTKAPPWRSAPSVPAIEPPHPALLPGVPDPSEATLEVPCFAPRGAVLPFAPPLPPASGRQRLVRFDTQTGEPLATPRWVDDATPAEPLT